MPQVLDRASLRFIEQSIIEHPSIRDAVAFVRKRSDGDTRLAICLLPENYQALSNKVLKRWRTVYDLTYGDAGPGPSFVGWNSSYTGQRMSGVGTEEWRDATVDRIRTLRPRHVLELGCGTGLLLSQLAPHCESYVGSDISARAIRVLQSWASTREDLKHVELLHQEASDFTNLRDRRFDTIVVNSVVQYFPDVTHLLEFIEGATSLLTSDGKLFLGDIRHLGLLSLFQTSVQFAKASESGTVGQLRSTIAQAVELERELFIDPHFFLDLLDSAMNVRAVEILMKRGSSDIELTRYRYDAILYANAAEQSEERLLDWAIAPPSMEELDECLRSNRPALVSVRGVSNQRLAHDLATQVAIDAASEDATIADVQRSPGNEIGGEDPESFFALAERHGYDAIACPTLGASDGRFDVVLADRHRLQHAPSPAWWKERSRPPASATTNNPLAASLQRELGPVLQVYLNERLPNFSATVEWVVAPTALIGPDGGLDRSAASREFGIDDK